MPYQCSGREKVISASVHSLSFSRWMIIPVLEPDRLENTLAKVRQGIYKRFSSGRTGSRREQPGTDTPVLAKGVP